MGQEPSRALQDYETILKAQSGSPCATAWYVDLLWRSGQSERAEQVWSSVRANRKVSLGDEGPLLEAKSLLNRGHYQLAERALAEARPGSGVLQTERCLLLAWTASTKAKHDEAAEWLTCSEGGLYPAAALEVWRLWIGKRAKSEDGALVPEEKLAPFRPATEANAPTRASLSAWLLHRAALALQAERTTEAGEFLQRALINDSTVASLPFVAAALPEMRIRSFATAVAETLGPEQNPIAPATLTGLVRLLEATDAGTILLKECLTRDRSRATAALETLLDQPSLPAQIAHHCALLQMRSAIDLGERGQTLTAGPHWRLAWRCWISFLSSSLAENTAVDPNLGRLLDWLLSQHRVRIRDRLASSDIDSARKHWGIVQDLNFLVQGHDPRLAEMIADRVRDFREDLATEYILATREAMRVGTIAEGMRADYEKGLSFLRRLLSLDRTNIRLLTALVEICNEWFFDLYTLGPGPTLAEQVERFTPFATQLARIIENAPGELASRSALSDYFKVRGFVAADTTQRLRHYHEALHLQPCK